jgi:hypothetical protein
MTLKTVFAMIFVLALAGCAPPAGGPGGAVQAPYSLDRGSDLRNGGDGGGGGGGM